MFVVFGSIALDALRQEAKILLNGKELLMKTAKKLGLLTLVMLIFVPTFGFRNVTTNAVALGSG